MEKEGQYKESLAGVDRARESFKNHCPEEHFGPKDTEEKRSFIGQRVKCLYL